MLIEPFSLLFVERNKRGHMTKEKICIYNYTLSILLKYNSYDLRDKKSKSFAQVISLTEPIEWEEKMSNIYFSDTDNTTQNIEQKVLFTITCEDEDSKTEIESVANEALNRPKPYFILTIQHLLASSQTMAWRSIEGFIDRSCRALTLMINDYFGEEDRAAFQHRVYADYATCKVIQKTQIDESKCRTGNIDENGNIIIEMYTTIGISISESLTFISKMRPERFIKYYDNNLSYKTFYIEDQLYMALGDEKIESKFFHLASIIEFIEREYNMQNNSKLIFNSSEKIKIVKKKLINCVDSFESLDIKARERLKNHCTCGLNFLTDIGRDEKLNNIFHNMGINEIQIDGKNIIVDKNYCNKITNLRNIYFHGKDGKNKQSLSNDVAELLIICTKVLRYTISEDKKTESP